MHKCIYIYKDEGVSLCHAQALKFSLKGTLSNPIHWISSKEVVSENWEMNALAFIIPGGRDVPYHRSLQGSGNKKILSYVMAGGSYLGICAGSYYGCKSIEFDIGHPLEVQEERELKFYPGIARGPAYGYGTFKYENESSAHLAPLILHPEGKRVYSYYNGGCYFVEDSLYTHIEVMARYDDIINKPAAIIRCKVGLGQAILCGVHPEVGAHNLSTNDAYFLGMKKALEKIEDQRHYLFKLLINKLIHNTAGTESAVSTKV